MFNMTKIHKYIFIFALLPTLIAVGNQNAYPDVEGKNIMLLVHTSLETERIKHVDVDRLLEVLKIKPGMTILDIGAGAGYFSYEFAKAVGKKGKVFATDTVSYMIDYITEQKNQRGLDNLYPILVQKNGVDEFYAKQKYDLIFLSLTYLVLRNPFEYFKQLKQQLTKNGSLVIIEYSTFLGFTPEDITDFEGLVAELSCEPENSPFFQGLSKPTQDLIKHYSSDKLDQTSKQKIIDDFNKILYNINFCNRFMENEEIKKEIPLSAQERTCFNGTYKALKQRGVFEEGQKLFSTRKVPIIRRHNKLIIEHRFQKYFYNDGKDITNRKVNFITEELKPAGYKLESVYDFIPFQSVLVFTVDKNQ